MSAPPNLFPDESRLPAPYMHPHQARTRPPTVYENELGDALEAAFAAGIWDLDALVERLNEYGLRTPEGQPWTLARFQAVMERLGA
jgi:hypothetical protein